MKNKVGAFAGGGLIGMLGGLVGLGGAEFRLPLLIGAFRFAALEAVILNKAMSLVVVLTALPARLATVTAAELGSRYAVAVNLLAGSMIGTWAGAAWAVRARKVGTVAPRPTSVECFRKSRRVDCMDVSLVSPQRTQRTRRKESKAGHEFLLLFDSSFSILLCVLCVLCGE